MRRPLGLALLLLVIGVPTAHASDVAAGVSLITPTQADLTQTGNLSASGDLIFEWGETTAYGFFDIFSSGSGPTTPASRRVTDLVPGTAYHARVRLDTGNSSDDATSGDLPFTTPPLGGSLLAVPSATFVGATSLDAVIPDVLLYTTCADPVSTSTGSVSMKRYRAYSVTNPAAIAGCVTVDVKTACPALQVRSYAGSFTGASYDGAMAGTSLPGQRASTSSRLPPAPRL